MIKKLAKRIAAAIGRPALRVIKHRVDSPPGGIHLVLGDRLPDVAGALSATFADVPLVEVVEGDLLKSDCDAIVSPANSFGDMGGGIDKAIDDAFEGELQPHVQAVIAEQYLGELPVGTAVIIPTSGIAFPFVIVAPTMRTPGSVATSINAYLAMRAILANVLRFNESQPHPINSVAIPGLCTGVGGMTAAESANQMRTAYDNIILQGWRRVKHPVQAPYASRS